MPFYLSFWLLFLQWLLYAVSQITTNNSNENLHFNEGFVRKNKHTATDYNAGSGYRRVLKKIIYFGPVQQPYKETDTNAKVLSWAGFAEVLVCVIFFTSPKMQELLFSPKLYLFATESAYGSSIPITSGIIFLHQLRQCLSQWYYDVTWTRKTNVRELRAIKE